MKAISLAASAAVLTALSLGPVTQAVASGGPTPGEVQHWGAHFGDSLSGDTSPQFWPAGLTFPDPAPVVQVGSSNAAQYALLADGSVWAWGQGTHGELRNGGTANSFASPVQVQFPAGVQIAFLATDAMPFDTALAVDTNGNAWGWGLNQRGELCLGNTTAYNLPVRLPLTGVTTAQDAPVQILPPAGVSYVALASGGSTSYGLTAGGGVYAWGLGRNGQLGTGSRLTATAPVQVPASPASLISATANDVVVN